ncbi:MAG: TadE/TadG family type IV pilus assembly protein [Candidatus Korobacteraceae bacterium]
MRLRTWIISATRGSPASRYGTSLSTASDGQSLIETAILLPMLVIMLCFAVDTGYYMLVASNLVSASRVAVEYGAQGYSSPGQLQLPGAGPIATTSTVSALAVGDLSGLVGASTTATVAVCSKTIGTVLVTGKLTTKCTTYGSGTQQYTPDPDPESPMFLLQRVDVVYTVQPPIPLSFFSLSVLPPLTVHRMVEFRVVD